MRAEWLEVLYDLRDLATIEGEPVIASRISELIRELRPVIKLEEMTGGYRVLMAHLYRDTVPKNVFFFPEQAAKNPCSAIEREESL